ncbi:hypothetical protein C0J52_13393 [Blattella germanica]|nr:hypothetical protein C0J52_13393 [Blattella germanica]
MIAQSLTSSGRRAEGRWFGKFAAVRKCTHRQTGVAYAAKFIRKRRRAMDQRQDILHEVAVLKLSASSSRIVRLHEVADGGELQRVLDTEEGLEEVQAIRVMRQILEGLSFLHDNNIAHLDLKPQNMLLTAEYPDCDIKLCDFGISRVIQNAPEILSYEPISLATDICNRLTSRQCLEHPWLSGSSLGVEKPLNQSSVTTIRRQSSEMHKMNETKTLQAKSGEKEDLKNDISDESDQLPLHKRPKNSPYPVACCHLHSTQHHHSSITNSPVEITVDRGIIC